MPYCRMPLAVALVLVGTWSHAEEDALKMMVMERSTNMQAPEGSWLLAAVQLRCA